MTEKTALGQQYCEENRQKAIKEFSRKFTQAEERTDYFRIDELTREGLANDFPIPTSTDPEVIDIICAIFRDLI